MANYRKLTQDELTELLNYSDLNPDNYDEWTLAGMILKHEGNENREIWNDWSRQSPKYDPEEIDKKWQSFNGADGGKDITVGTLIKQALRNGYRFNNTESLAWDAVIEDDGYSSRNKKKIEPTKKLEQSKKTKVNNIKNTKLYKALTSESGKYSNLINNAHANLKESPEGMKYYTDRGISEGTIDHYKAGWVTNFEGTGLTGALIAGTEDGYAIRNVNFEKRNEEILKLPTDKQKEQRKFNPKYKKPSTDKGAIDVPVGLKYVIQQPNLKDISTGYKMPVFIFEGYFDVLSFYEATGIDGISLNGIGNMPSVIDALKAFSIDRPIIIALDNDETGNKENQKHFNELKNAGFNVIWNQSFYGDYKDANEFLVNDKDGFKRAIDQAIKEPYKEFEKTLNANHEDKFNNYIENRQKAPAILTGLDTLDGEGFLNGGLRPSMLYIIGAISSLGKTSLVLQIADNIATAGTPVLYFSLEMNKYELMAKSISRYTYIESEDTKTHKPYLGYSTLDILDGKKRANAVEYEREFLDDCIKLYFNDTGKNLRILESRDISKNGEVPADLIREKVNEQYSITGKAPVVIVDYFQILGKTKEQNYLSEKEFIDNNVTKLKQLAVEFDTPVIIISSFNRKSYNEEAGMDSFLGSSGIEYSADVLLVLERNIKLTEKQEIRAGDTKQKTFYYATNVALAKKKETVTGIKWLKLKVLKNRTGQSDGEIGLVFNSIYNYFHDYGEIYEETGTTESPEEEDERYSQIMSGKKTVRELPDPPEVHELI